MIKAKFHLIGRETIWRMNTKNPKQKIHFYPSASGHVVPEGTEPALWGCLVMQDKAEPHKGIIRDQEKFEPLQSAGR